MMTTPIEHKIEEEVLTAWMNQTWILQWFSKKHIEENLKRPISDADYQTIIDTWNDDSEMAAKITDMAMNYARWVLLKERFPHDPKKTPRK